MLEPVRMIEEAESTHSEKYQKQAVEGNDFEYFEEYYLERQKMMTVEVEPTVLTLVSGPSMQRAVDGIYINRSIPYQ